MFNDSFIVDRFQEFSEWSQIRLGRNCYWWEYASCYASGLFCFLVIGLRIFDGIQSNDIMKAFETIDFLVYIMFISIALFMSTQLKSKKIKSESDTPKRSSAEPVLKFRRIWFLFASLAHAALQDPAGMVFMTFSLMFYFESCVPLPPSEVDRRRVKSFKTQTA